MNKALPIPNVQAHCEQCEKETCFQLQITNEINKVEGAITIESTAIWFCTECHEQEIACDAYLGWSN